ncbi:MAG: HNH endonuclease [Candidatus Eremiobacteraeota bacterium]|nr:HNH endonuclease [Candidatus Eremiobacteraeota bacterium]
MAEAVLSEGTAKDRARHQVIIHTVEDVEGGWYETDRGVLPASPEVVQQALQSGHALRAEELTGISAEGHRIGASSSQDESKAANPPGGSSSNDRAQGVDPNPLGGSANNESSRRFETDSSTGAFVRRPSESPEPNPRGDLSWNDCLQGNPNPSVDAGSSNHCSRNFEIDFFDDSSVRGQSENLDPNHPGDSSTPSADQNLVFQRKSVPNATIRKLYARANKRCERCQTSGCRLHIHHCTPVSEGGGDNSLATLELLCSACHSLEHEKDFKQKPHWSRARDSAMLDHPFLFSDAVARS